MTRGARATLASRIDELREGAAALASEKAGLRAASTPAIQRAALRFLGINGLDESGEPLAAVLVERLSSDDRLDPEWGVALPLALAAAGRGLAPQGIALEASAGRIDVASEGSYLRQPDRRVVAEGVLAAWREEAWERVDANRTARHELTDTLGPPEEPLLCVPLGSVVQDAAEVEARGYVAAGADAVLVRVPRGRELVLGAGEPPEEHLPNDLEPPPGGSQRGLAGLRAALDEIAAERGRYVSLATFTEGLAAPEQAVVAGFERIDLVFADPFDEIALGVEADRALADHAAAHRLLARSGATLVLGTGPLLVGPELRHGEDVAARVRVGRSIAAQAVAAAWAGASGLAPERVLYQAPFEALDGGTDASLLLAELIVRRALLGEGRLVVTEPDEARGDDWRTALALCLMAGGPARLLLTAGGVTDFPEKAAVARSSARVADRLVPALRRENGERLPVSDALVDEAAALAGTAVTSLERARRDGWEALVGSDVLLGQGLGRSGGVVMLTARHAAVPWLPRGGESAT